MKLIVLHIYLLAIVTSAGSWELIRVRAGEDDLSGKESAVISGRVKEKRTGLPVKDVIIRWQGTSHSTISDADGNYRISRRSGSQNLIFSRPGWAERKIRVCGRTELEIKMKRKKQTSVPPQPAEDLPADSLRNTE